MPQDPTRRRHAQGGKAFRRPGKAARPDRAQDDRMIPDLETAQRILLDGLLPNATVRRVPWSRGTTQVIEAGSGRSLLFMHGGFSQATEWLPLWPLLAQRYRLIAIDRPGHGLADPFDYTGQDTLEVGSSFLAEMLDVLGLDRAVIVANSMGARWALELALRNPKRIERLIAIGAPAGSCARLPLPLLAMRWPITRSLMRRLFLGSTADKVRDFAGRVLVAHPERLSEEFLVAKAAGQRRNHAAMLSFASRVMALTSIHPSMLLADVWQRVEVPVRFIWGDADAFDLPASAQRPVCDLPAGAELTVIRDAGHLPWLDEPEAVARAIDHAVGPAARHHAGADRQPRPS
jgi:pimeloyl-ACP methyl ester carboxylesterase